MADELKAWRNQFSVEDLKFKIRESTKDRHSFAGVGTGGLLCTIAAARAGLYPLWGSDNDEIMQLLWQDFVGNISLGDFNEVEPESLRSPHVLHSTLPCENFSSTGNGMGGRGVTGCLYVNQAEWLVRLAALIIILEMSNNAPAEFPEDVAKLKNGLRDSYVLFDDVLPVWEHGDGSYRHRYIIFGVHRSLGDVAQQFKWPSGVYNEARHPVAFDFAVPDGEVPEKYLRHHSTPPTVHKWREPKAGMLHHVARIGEGVGHSTNPHSIQSWWGLFNTQLTTNGGAQRVMLDYLPGSEVKTTRLTVPEETVAVASLHPSYRGWLRGLWEKNSCMRQRYPDFDSMLHKCVNMGVPLRLMTALDAVAISILEKAGIAPDVPANRVVKANDASAVGAEEHVCDMQRVRSMMADWRDR